MAEPRVPGDRGTTLSLPCGEAVHVRDIDMGMRELACPCGETHAVVVDVHPLGRFVPEFLGTVLRETVESADGGAFSTAHLMGMVMEEFPDRVIAADVADDGRVGYALVWVTDFDARRLHEVIVELVVELMEHAISHADDPEAVASFEAQMHELDIPAFVEAYRRERDFEDEFDRPA